MKKNLNDFEIFDVMTKTEIEELKALREWFKESDFLVPKEEIEKVIFKKKNKKCSNNKITFKSNLKNKRLDVYGVL